MKVQVNNNKRYIQALDRSLEESPFKQYIDELAERLEGFRYFYWGGIVRNAILNESQGKELVSNDIDIIIDGTNNKSLYPEKDFVEFDKMLEGLENIRMNRYDVPKWTPKKGVEIDISVFSNCNKVRTYGKIPLKIHRIVEGCDLSTSAIAYDPIEKKIFSYGALESYENRTIDVNFTIGNDPAAQLPRLVLHSKKLGFEIGKRSKGYISSIYSDLYMKSKMNMKIFKNLRYWGYEDHLFEIISQLGEIAFTNKRRISQTA